MAPEIDLALQIALLLTSLIGQGARIHSTLLSDEYDFEAFNASQDKLSIKLFALDERGKLQVFSSRHELEPAPGWTIISLANDQETESVGDKLKGTFGGDVKDG